MKFNTRYLALVALVALGAQNAMAMKVPVEVKPKLSLWQSLNLGENLPIVLQEFPYHVAGILGIATAIIGTVDYKLSKANSLKSYLTGHRNLLLKNRHSTAAKVIGQLTRLAALSTVGMASYSLGNTGWNVFNCYALGNCWNCHKNSYYNNNSKLCVSCRCRVEDCPKRHCLKSTKEYKGYCLLYSEGCDQHACQNPKCLLIRSENSRYCRDHKCTECGGCTLGGFRLCAQCKCAVTNCSNHNNGNGNGYCNEHAKGRKTP